MSAPTLSPDAQALLAALKPEQSPLSSKAQAELWIKLGIVTFSIVIIGGFGLILAQIAQADWDCCACPTDG